MPLTDEQMAKRKQTNKTIFRVLSIIFVAVGLLMVLTNVGLVGWAILAVGLFMGLAWVPGMVKT